MLHVSISLQAPDHLASLFEDYFNWKLETYPEWATKLHIKGFDAMVEDFSMHGIREKASKCQEFSDRSTNIDLSDVVDEQNLIYKRVLEV